MPEQRATSADAVPMRSVIQQSVILPATVDSLFEMYLDPVAHAAFTGSPVTISAEPGAEFRAFDGQLSGRVLAVLRPRLIVQSWRSVKFRAEDADSTLILTLTPETADGLSARVDLVHLDVPAHDFQDVSEGWRKYYWTPWRGYLEQP